MPLSHSAQEFINNIRNNADINSNKYKNADEGKKLDIILFEILSDTQASLSLITTLANHNDEESSFYYLRALLRLGMDIEMEDDDKKTLLMKMTQFRNPKYLCLLLDHGANIEARDNRGMTPLMHAAKLGNGYCLNQLLKMGANVEATDHQGMTPLMHAATSGSGYGINQLLKNGAEINLKDNRNMTALMHAVVRGHYYLLKMLLDNRADIAAINKDNMTPLMLAAQSGFSQCLGILLEAEININPEYKGWYLFGLLPCRFPYRSSGLITVYAGFGEGENPWECEKILRERLNVTSSSDNDSPRKRQRTGFFKPDSSSWHSESEYSEDNDLSDDESTMLDL